MMSSLPNPLSERAAMPQQYATELRAGTGTGNAYQRSVSMSSKVLQLRESKHTGVCRTVQASPEQREKAGTPSYQEQT